MLKKEELTFNEVEEIFKKYGKSKMISAKDKVNSISEKYSEEKDKDEKKLEVQEQSNKNKEVEVKKESTKEKTLEVK